jgi:dTMP kinase
VKVRGRAPGRLIIVEGIDGTGKTTLVKGLYRRLLAHGRPAVCTFEPSDGPWGRKLRKSFSAPERLAPESELELFQKDRRDHVAQVLKPDLAEGKVVVCDRYYFSTMAYQGARGLDPEAIRKANEAFAPTPDLVLLLDLAPEVALRRIRDTRGQTPNSFEQLAYLERVAAIFETLKDPFVIRLDAVFSPERLLDLAWDCVQALD